MKKVDCTCKEYVVYNKTVDLVNYDVQPNVVVTPIQALVAGKMDSALHWILITVSDYVFQKTNIVLSL